MCLGFQINALWDTHWHALLFVYCSQLDEKYSASRDEVMMLHREREHYEENMKKAFMRGVCALNMEAMNMFQEPEPGATDGTSAAAAQSHSM